MHLRRTFALLLFALSLIVIARPVSAAGEAPQITVQPQDVITNAGSEVTLTSAATGDRTGLIATYQQSKDQGATWVDRSRCDGNAVCQLMLGGARLSDSGSWFRVVWENPFGTAVSRTATYTVCDATSCLRPSFAIDPGEDLVSGQAVTVTSSDFPPGLPVKLQTCVAGGSTCTAAEDVAAAAADGTFSATYHVARVIRTTDCLRMACEVQATVRGVRFGAAPLAFAHLQPDGRVRRRSDGRIFFDDVYFPYFTNTQERRRHPIAPGGTWVYAVQVQNDGDREDDLTVVDIGNQTARFEVRWYYAWYDVTALVLGDGFTIPDRAPGQVATLALEFRAAPDAAGQAEAVLAFRSGLDPAAQDVLRLAAYVPRR